MSYYKKHLNFESNQFSKEYQLAKCNSILGMIARLKDMNKSLKETYEYFYGKSINGNILVSKHDFERYNIRLKIIERLKKYYNNNLDKLTKF